MATVTTKDRGSSPRLRGTDAHIDSRFVEHRFIPASAGNGSSRRRPAKPIPVHPRVCGERWVMADGLPRIDGSSPRLRGTGIVILRDFRDFRFIPASAGNGGTRSTRRITPPVHPRVCGERGRDRRNSRCLVGSSPRLRGTVCPLRTRLAPRRFIPASAGNGPILPRRSRRLSVHPRVCGERYVSIVELLRDHGSSPRLRGTGW